MKKDVGCVTYSDCNNWFEKWMVRICKRAQLIKVVDSCEILNEKDELVGHFLIIIGPVELVRLLERVTDLKAKDSHAVKILIDKHGKIVS